MKKGVSPTTALIILVGVLLTFSLAIVLITATYPSHISKEAIIVLPESHLTCKDSVGRLALYLVNAGINPIIIYKVEVDDTEFKISKVDGLNVTEAYVEADGEQHVIEALSKDFKLKTPTTYKVTLYIRGGGEVECIVEFKA